MPHNKHLRFFITLAYIALGVLAFWLAAKFALPWLAPFIIAFLISRIIEHPVSFFEKKLRFPRPLASLLFTIIFYGILSTIVYFGASELIRMLVSLFEKLRSLNIDAIVDKLRAMFYNVLSGLPLNIQDFIYVNIEGWLSDLVSALQDLISPALSLTANLATSLPSILIFLIAAFVATYFLSCDYLLIKQKVYSILPENGKRAYYKTVNQASVTILAYLRAVAVLICITFVELSIGLAILRVPNFIVIAALIALIDALPILGTGWVFLPWGIISLFMGNFLMTIGLALLYGVIVFVRNLIEPKIVGEHIGLHPLITLISMYIGIRIFGILGMFSPILVALIKRFYEWGYFDFIKPRKSPPKPIDEEE